MSDISRRVAAFPRWVRWGLAAVLGAAIVASVFIVAFRVPESERMPRRFCVVTPGKLYRSGQPDETELRNVLRKYEIRTILLVRGTEYPECEAELRVAGEHGVRIVPVPVSSTEPFRPDALAKIRQVFADPTGHPILVHCKHGVARTGVVVALWRIEQDGWAGDRAVDEMLERGYPPREEGKPTQELLRHWKPGDQPTSVPAQSTDAAQQDE